MTRWWESALCQQVDASSEVWFPPLGGSCAEALRICRMCDPAVRDACLRDALDFERAQPGGPYGVRGGKTGRQRKQMLDATGGKQRKDSAVNDRVRELAAQGMSPAEISTKVGRSRAVVVGILYRSRLAVAA